MMPKFFGNSEMDLTSFMKWVTKLDGEVTCIKKFPACEAAYGGWGMLDARVIEAVKQRGIEKLYSHQSKAVSLAMAGHDIVIVTPTASGKTLCYNLPVADSLFRDKATRALYLFPTKALAQDQLTELGEFSGMLEGAIKSYTYDGDTPAEKRALARREGNVIITNPDMLNAGILPHHTSWSEFFKGLKYIVVDELHTYRGIFGSHMANLFARLERVCDFYGSHPTFICCSATIANPAEHASALTGRDVELISENGAPSSEKQFMIYNPRLLDKDTGVRRSSLFETARIASEALCSGISTIIFTRSRLNVELLLKSLRRKLSDAGQDPELVTGYRGGYLPKERREIERGLRSGKLRGVVSTNALELGIDIGSLELAVLHGYPGSIASAWQQVGRAGRRGGMSGAVMVASAMSLDQFLAEKPQWFLGASPERARIDPSNPYIQVSHVRCSAFELPFARGEKFGGRDISEIIDYLAQHGVLQLSGDGDNERYYWQHDSYPAATLSMRSATSETYEIVDITNERRPHLIGTMDRHSASALIFPGAIYFHGGQSYIVESLDTEKFQCFVKIANADYYTESESAVRVTVTDEFERRGLFGWGDAVVASAPSSYKKIKLTTHENVGHGEIKLPEDKMETTACWLEMPQSVHDEPLLAAAMNGLTNLIRNAAPLFLMCDRGDIQVNSRLRDPYLHKPAIFLTDNIPGGVGLAEGTFELGAKLIRACSDIMDSCKCKNGCPACVGVPPDEGTDLKDVVGYLIDEILKS
jgi:DEAD/DEAH box helicase domain-containing protein